jgi:hypothetical protein
MTRQPDITDTPVVRTKIEPPPTERIMSNGFPVALSPAGDQLAYVTQSTTGYRTLVQRVGELDAYTELSATSLQNLVFSPDGKWLAYTDGEDILRVAASGGRGELLGKLRQLTSVTATRGNLSASALAWTPDDQLLIGSDVGLFAMSARGGVVRAVTDTTKALVDARTAAGLPEAASAFLLLYARIGAVLMMLPLFGEEAVPARLRLLLGLGTTAGLWGLLSGRVLPVGGMDATTIPAWRAAGAAGFGIGSAIYKPGDDATAVAAKARALRAWRKPPASRNGSWRWWKPSAHCRAAIRPTIPRSMVR